MQYAKGGRYIRVNHGQRRVPTWRDAEVVARFWQHGLPTGEAPEA